MEKMIPVKRIGRRKKHSPEKQNTLEDYEGRENNRRVTKRNTTKFREDAGITDSRSTRSKTSCQRRTKREQEPEVNQVERMERRPIT